MKQIRFLSNNACKTKEVSEILKTLDVDVIPIARKIEELQTDNVNHLVKEKALKAFKMIGRPLFVEHNGLFIDKINQLPGGLTQVFWDKLQADKFAELFGADVGESKAKAITTICYIDGKNTHIFDGEVEGSIISVPKGDRNFQWDCIFVPDGYDQTFAEMGALKNDISMRKTALQKFADFLKQ